jgi:hypothetical protein
MPSHDHHAMISAVYFVTSVILAVHSDVTHALCAFAIALVYAIHARR